MEKSLAIFECIKTRANGGKETSIALQILKDDQLVCLSYQELFTEVTKNAALLQALGVKPGYRVALAASSSMQWVVQFLAISSLQATVVALDPGLEKKQLRKQLDLADPYLIIVDTKLYETLLGQDNLDLTLLVISQADYDLKVVQTKKNHTYVDDGDKEIAAILFTSGTTGEFKGVELTHFALIQSVKIGINSVAAVSSDNFLCILPAHHVYGLAYNILAPLFIGAKITFVQAVQGDIILSTMAITKPSIFLGVPRIFELFVNKISDAIEAKPKLVKGMIKLFIKLNLKLRGALKLNFGKKLFAPVHKTFGGQIRYFISGSSALSPKLYEYLEGLGFTVVEGYGLTETSACVSLNKANNRKQGTVGMPPEGTYIELRNLEAGKGEICIKGPTLMQGYFRNAEATAEAIKDGWFYTGDIGYFDADGYLVIDGRLKDIVVLPSGKKVMASLVEEYYKNIPEIAEIAIVGLSLANGNGEQLAAAIKLADNIPVGLNACQYKQLVRDKLMQQAKSLPEWWAIQKVYFVQEIPKTTTLKVKRKELILQLNAQDKSLGKDEGRIILAENLDGSVNSNFNKIITCIERLVKAHQLEQNFQINAKTSLRLDIGLDSLSKLELLNSLEKTFDIKISSEAFAKVDTIEELTELVADESSNQEGKGYQEGDSNLEALPVIADYKETLLKKCIRKLICAVYKRYFKLTGEGTHHIPDEPFILCGNHVSHLDTLALVLSSKKPLNDYVILAAKDYFFKNKYQIKLLSILFNLVPFDRTGSATAIKINEAYLQQCRAANKNILLFPEGTRSLSGELQDFKLGATLFAKKLNMKIVPAYIDGSYQALPKGKKIPRKAKITTYYSEALEINESVEVQANSDEYHIYRGHTVLLREKILSLKQQALNRR